MCHDTKGSVTDYQWIQNTSMVLQDQIFSTNNYSLIIGLLGVQLAAAGPARPSWPNKAISKSTIQTHYNLALLVAKVTFQYSFSSLLTRYHSTQHNTGLSSWPTSQNSEFVSTFLLSSNQPRVKFVLCPGNKGMTVQRQGLMETAWAGNSGGGRNAWLTGCRIPLSHHLPTGSLSYMWDKDHTLLPPESLHLVPDSNSNSGVHGVGNTTHHYKISAQSHKPTAMPPPFEISFSECSTLPR